MILHSTFLDNILYKTLILCFFGWPDLKQQNQAYLLTWFRLSVFICCIDIYIFISINGCWLKLRSLLSSRGQESAGIVTSTGDNRQRFSSKKYMGLVNSFTEEDLKKLRGNLGIGVLDWKILRYYWDRLFKSQIPNNNTEYLFLELYRQPHYQLKCFIFINSICLWIILLPFLCCRTYSVLHTRRFRPGERSAFCRWDIAWIDCCGT